MKLIRRSPDVLVFKDDTLFLAFMTLFMLAMGLGFFSMAADKDMWVRDFSGDGKAGIASRIAWIVFGLFCLAGSVFSALQRRAVVIDRRAGFVREVFGTLFPFRSTTHRISDFTQVKLNGDEFSAALLLDSPRKRIVFEVGSTKRLEPFAAALAEHTRLTVVRTKN